MTRTKAGLVVLTLALIGAAGTEASAQAVPGTNASVTVNLGVLDTLGPAPTLPQLLERKQPDHRLTTTAKPRAKHASKKTAKKKKPHKATASTASAGPVVLKRPTHTAANAPRVPVEAKPLEAPASAAVPGATPPPASAAPAQTEAGAAPPPAPATAPAAAPPAAPASSEAGPRVAAATQTAAATAIKPSAPPPSAAPAPAVTPAAAPAAIAVAAPPGTTRVMFSAGVTDLPDGAKRDLDALAQRLNANEQQRIQLVAYATGGSEEANQARRISLSRALAVRTYLIDHNVRSSRMDVRALGNRSEGDGPQDRVDIVLIER